MVLTYVDVYICMHLSVRNGVQSLVNIQLNWYSSLLGSVRVAANRKLHHVLQFTSDFRIKCNTAHETCAVFQAGLQSLHHAYVTMKLLHCHVFTFSRALS